MKYFCPHCGKQLKKSSLSRYDFECLDCGEDFYECETIMKTQMFILKFHYAGSVTRFDELYGTFSDCKKELFDQLCMKLGCFGLGEVSSWQELDAWATTNGHFVWWSPKKEFAVADNYYYEIVKAKE